VLTGTVTPRRRGFSRGTEPYGHPMYWSLCPAEGGIKLLPYFVIEKVFRAVSKQESPVAGNNLLPYIVETRQENEMVI